MQVKHPYLKHLRVIKDLVLVTTFTNRRNSLWQICALIQDQHRLSVLSLKSLQVRTVFWVKSHLGWQDEVPTRTEKWNQGDLTFPGVFSKNSGTHFLLSWRNGVQIYLPVWHTTKLSFFPPTFGERTGWELEGVINWYSIIKIWPDLIIIAWTTGSKR